MCKVHCPKMIASELTGVPLVSAQLPVILETSMPAEFMQTGRWCPSVLWDCARDPGVLLSGYLVQPQKCLVLALCERCPDAVSLISVFLP